ncbi:hypothetical protein [Gorillibacterium massiliense]|uniref:hypothetical protein n=1 Tax=Gorillibacterium massiliense TaxID=1280390 RepID=UPI0004B92429|nr:hypothetical protein [Gorillibacterium massiliense]
MSVGLKLVRPLAPAKPAIGLERLALALYACLLLAVTVYQDFPLANSIGEIGRSPMVLFTPLFVFCEIAMLSKHKRVLHVSKLQKYLFGFILYLLFVSMAYVLVQFLQGSYSFGSENLLGKAVKVLFYFTLILLYVRHVQLVIAKLGSFRLLYGCFLSVVTLLLVIMILEMASMPNALPFLHAGSGPYWRVRLLTSESSTTGTIVVVYTGILVYLSRYLSSFAKVLSMLYVAGFFVFYLSVTGSKGFLIVFLLTLIAAMLKFLDFRKKKNFLLLIVAVAAMYYMIASFAAGVLTSFNNDIQNYTSSVTRMGTIVIAIVTVLHHPFGVGTGAYLIYFERYLSDSISFMTKFYYNVFGLSQINASELMQYSGSDKNLGVKSGLFQWIMFGGIPAVAFFYLMTKHLIGKVKSSLILFMALVFTLLSLLFVVLEIKYEIWLLFAFISALSGNHEADHSKASGEDS